MLGKAMVTSLGKKKGLDALQMQVCAKDGIFVR
jgi:hypothetical protein